MRWPWTLDTFPEKAAAIDRAELQARSDALAEVRVAETRQRIERRWLEAERAILARRTVRTLTFSIQLAPPVPVRQIRPLQWGQQRGKR